MNHNSPVFTLENSCQDCYKCVRECPCKAIRIVDGRAGIISELCVACGNCVRVCPADAKKIRPDLSRGRFLLSSGRSVYASLAPSWVSYFPGYTLAALIAALRKLGFAGAGETACGAQMVSAETGRWLNMQPPGVYISSACPAAVDYIIRYTPAFVSRIVPVVSPLLAHSKLLRRSYGDDIAVIFFGPCAAKKNEADRHGELLDLALTFDDLAEWIKQENIRPEMLDCSGAVPVPDAADEGRIYAIEGGMNETLRGNPGDPIRYVAVSGLDNLERLLRDDAAAATDTRCKLFIEALACHGGCVNGPVMHGRSTSLSSIIAAASQYRGGNSIGRSVPVPIDEEIKAAPIPETEVPEEVIVAGLHAVGKFDRADELNCGGCGYNTCREFARALAAGKAETAMCLSFLRQLAQKTSNALFRYIPSGVVLVDKNMNIIECNRHFAEFFGEDSTLAYEAAPGLAGMPIDKIADLAELLRCALDSGGEIERFNQVFGERIFHISAFSIAPRQIVGAIIQDVTQNELHREQVSAKAREVIQKNVATVQKIARYLGEHMAETEILLREVAGSYGEGGEKK